MKSPFPRLRTSVSSLSTCPTSDQPPLSHRHLQKLHSIPRGLSSEDEGVRIAISALGDMRNNARAGPSSPSTSASNGHQYPDASSPDFVSRVSHFPIVNTALKAYENTKASSRMVKYGAEMMESSMKTFYRPVLGRLPVDQLDEFACRQLDRLDNYRRPSSDNIRGDSAQRSSDTSAGADHDERDNAAGASSRPSSSSNAREYATDDDSMSVTSPPPASFTESRTPTPQLREREGEPSRSENQQQIVQRSRWQTVLLEAGGIGAAVSEESMRRLKYCLQWLQYATEHIDGQILILRDFIVSLQSAANGSTSPDALISPSHLRTLTEIRKDVVHTVRQVVDVVSKYAGGALPEPARSRVRGFMLHLPQRWASATQGLPVESSRPSVPSHGTSSAAEAASSGGGASGATRRGRQARQAQNRERGTATPVSSRPVSPISSPRVKPKSTTGAAGGAGAGGTGTVGPPAPTAGSATAAAQRILTLAMESLDMMRGVTSVMKESLDRADAWVERLRVVGIQRGQISEQQSQAQSEDMPPPPPPSSSSSSDVNGSSSSSSTLAHRRKHSLPHLTSSASTSAVSTPAQDTPYSSVPTTPVELSLGAVHQLNQVQVQQSPMGAAQMQSLPPLAALSLGGRVVEEKAGTGAVVGDGGREAMDVDVDA